MLQDGAHRATPFCEAAGWNEVGVAGKPGLAERGHTRERQECSCFSDDGTKSTYAKPRFPTRPSPSCSAGPSVPPASTPPRPGSAGLSLPCTSLTSATSPKDPSSFASSGSAGVGGSPADEEPHAPRSRLPAPCAITLGPTRLPAPCSVTPGLARLPAPVSHGSWPGPPARPCAITLGPARLAAPCAMALGRAGLGCAPLSPPPLGAPVPGAASLSAQPPARRPLAATLCCCGCLAARLVASPSSKKSKGRTAPLQLSPTTHNTACGWESGPVASPRVPQTRSPATHSTT